ncbi:MAG: guanine deaminase [Curvibacter sp.]|nr:guanine deaminase [Curvibacter sp.]
MTVADSTNPTPTRLALRADLLDFVAEPEWGAVESPALRWRPDHWLLLEGGRIVGAQPASLPAPEGYQTEDHRGRLILPGFIDTHVHSPQLDVIGSYGSELLDWLNTYTFPAEMRYADDEVAEQGAQRFLDALLARGTTSAVVFPTVHRISADRLFAAARQRGMRLIAGKVLMDRHAPEALCDDVAGAERDCLDLIERWHGLDRLAYAVTVRFAPTSSEAQLAMAGALCRADPTLYMQTHVAENRDEVRWVQQLFPQARSYLDVYERAGLLHGRSVLAHGIWLDGDDRALLRERGAQISHSPSSNLFLGSGLFDWPAARQAGAAVSLSSDVGGGTDLCLLASLREAYKVQALAGQRLTAWSALHAATAGAAAALGLGHEIGSLEAGATADLCIWDWSTEPLAAHRLGLARSLHEKMFAWMTLADRSHLVQSRVAGVTRYRRPGSTAH